MQSWIWSCVRSAVEAAGSGHPGTAMSLAPAAYLIFQRLLRHDPTDPAWGGRDEALGVRWSIRHHSRGCQR